MAVAATETNNKRPNHYSVPVGVDVRAGMLVGALHAAAAFGRSAGVRAGVDFPHCLLCLASYPSSIFLRAQTIGGAALPLLLLSSFFPFSPRLSARRLPW